MPKEFSRARRIGAQIQRDLAGVVQQHARDSRLGMITITSVDVSPDLKLARVYVTAYGTSVAPREIVAGLSRRAGEMRQYIARRLRTRSVPRVEFRFDESVERGARMSALLDSLQRDSAGAPEDGSDGESQP